MYEIISSNGHHTLINKNIFYLIVALAIWEIIWKGVALWRAGRNRQPGWFIAMLILNTAGILEIIYVIFFQAKPKKEK
ncbi:MAG TPA: DUF5652 family protein [Candidatus Saccharimonadales bacterium]|nr:DUF5652 family protein [Candidatus Saccharimonadales bacterium]